MAPLPWTCIVVVDAEDTAGSAHNALVPRLNLVQNLESLNRGDDRSCTCPSEAPSQHHLAPVLLPLALSHGCLSQLTRGRFSCHCEWSEGRRARLRHNQAGQAACHSTSPLMSTRSPPNTQQLCWLATSKDPSTVTFRKNEQSAMC